MGAFKLGKMTFGSLFKKPETVMYPFQAKPQPEGLKGHIVIDVEQCILCGMCDRNCTTNCITVSKQDRYWEINPFNCIQCGYCITVCPKKCLHMDPNYWPASVAQTRERFEVPAQVKAKPRQGEAEPAKGQEKPASRSDSPAAAALRSAPSSRDAQLESLLSQLDPDKAKIVESALA